MRRKVSAYLQNHVAQLCEEHQIEWEVGSPSQEAEADDNTIYTPAIVGQKQYLIALHEIAHVVLEHYHRRHRVPILLQEAQAWEWALQRSLVKLNAASSLWIRECLANYWLWANKDGRANPDIPEFRALWADLRSLAK